LKLKEKSQGKNLVEETDFYLFHCPFAKMVQKAFDALMKAAVPGIKPEEIAQKFSNQVEPSLYLSKQYGNIYCGSVYLCLLGLLLQKP
jgi:3-hydroxy-3-methylglutaryl CoA synthase